MKIKQKADLNHCDEYDFFIIAIVIVMTLDIKTGRKKIYSV